MHLESADHGRDTVFGACVRRQCRRRYPIRGRGKRPSDRANQFKAVHLRHANVGDEGIEGAGLKQVERALSGQHRQVSENTAVALLESSSRFALTK